MPTCANEALRGSALSEEPSLLNSGCKRSARHFGLELSDFCTSQKRRAERLWSDDVRERRDEGLKFVSQSLLDAREKCRFNAGFNKNA